MSETKKSMTLREQKAWVERIKELEIEPSLSDYYSMRIALEVRRLYNFKIRDTRPVSLDQFILKYASSANPEMSQETIDNMTKVAKFGWAMRIRSQIESQKK